MAQWFQVGDRVRGRRINDQYDFVALGAATVIKVESASPGEAEGIPREAYSHSMVVKWDGGVDGTNLRRSTTYYQWVFELEGPVPPIEAAARAYIRRELVT